MARSREETGAKEEGGKAEGRGHATLPEGTHRMGLTSPSNFRCRMARAGSKEGRDAGITGP